MLPYQVGISCPWDYAKSEDSKNQTVFETALANLVICSFGAHQQEKRWAGGPQTRGILLHVVLLRSTQTEAGTARYLIKYYLLRLLTLSQWVHYPHFTGEVTKAQTQKGLPELPWATCVRSEI